jgi:hypothetical protein
MMSHLASLSPDIWLAVADSYSGFPIVPLIVVVLIAVAALTAIFAGSEERRENALAVLAALLRWKGR